MILLALASALAAPSLDYSARLTDTAGNPLSGSHAVRVSLYPTSSATTPLWTHSFPVTIDDGYFTATLETGDAPTTALDPAWFAGDVWVGLTVDAGTELTPREPLSDAPSALSAHTATHVPVSGSPGTSCTDPGAVTWDTSTSSLRVCAGGAWRSTQTAAPPVAWVYHQTTTGGTTGGSVGTSWTELGVESMSGNTAGVGVTVASGRFTLPPGKYLIEASVECYRIDSFGARIYDVTAGAEAIPGNHAYCAAAYVGATHVDIRGELNPTVTTTYRVEGIAEVAGHAGYTHLARTVHWRKVQITKVQ